MTSTVPNTCEIPKRTQNTHTHTYSGTTVYTIHW